MAGSGYPDWRVAVAELHGRVRAVETGLEAIREDIDSMQPRLSAVPLLDARTLDLAKDYEGLADRQSDDGRKVDQLLTGLKVAGVVAAALLTISLALTPYIVRSALRDAVADQARK
jgi:hypothetical protein